MVLARCKTDKNVWCGLPTREATAVSKLNVSQAEVSCLTTVHHLAITLVFEHSEHHGHHRHPQVLLSTSCYNGAHEPPL